MTTNLARKPHAICIAVAVTVLVGLGLLAKPAASQSSREAEGARLLKGAIDMHFHVDASAATSSGEGQHSISDVRLAASRGMRAVLLKDHNQPTASLVYLLRQEITGINIFGGVVMNLTNGGMNTTAVEYMARIKGSPGRIVWMPAGDSEIEFLHNRCVWDHPDCKAPFEAPVFPYKSFVAVSNNGELLPETKAVISVIAKNKLIFASGHIAPEEALLAFREARSQGVENMIATHAMDLPGKMDLEQMEEAAKLGAFIEFDFRNVLSEDARRMDAIRKIGPEHCFISEFWTNGVRKNPPPSQKHEYAGLDGMGAFVEAAHARGFTDHELDLMFKENQARLLGL